MFSDDTKLKIVLYTIVFLAVVAVIGLWEQIIKPVFGFLAEHILIKM
ncbi:MAG: hypothetical protein WCP18_01275 [bacterium]